jgi:glycosyltransferase involved in cell wall biosynthesis
MTETARKPVVLVFVGNYLPGHKAGGILRTIANTVDHLCDEFEFKVVTRDRDLGDEKPYEGLELNSWQKAGNALAYYLPPEGCTVANIGRVVRDTPHDVVYLNSFFDPLTVKVLFNVWLGAIPATRVVVAPRGEFAWASLRQKYLKKYVFTVAARALGLYGDITWHASSPQEAMDIIKVMKVDRAAIQVAFDFALRDPGQTPARATMGARSGENGLRVVFLSRVAREKNLDYAIRILREVQARVVFDIYGPTADDAYWSECQALIRQLPRNVTAAYRGVVEAADVVSVFSEYDLFLFPTGGEAYGQVIAEALLAGTPVLTSTETAWRNLEKDGLGWDFDLRQEDSFVEAIDSVARLSEAERESWRAVVRAAVVSRLADPSIPEAHRRLFTGAC